jgi:hypothetical protein
MKKLTELLEAHAKMLEENPYAYFELAYTRQTEWMAWLCTDSYENDEKRQIVARGQGSTPEEAAEDALKNLHPNTSLSNAPAMKGGADE